jgi:DNA gyrase subunit B
LTPIAAGTTSTYDAQHIQVLEGLEAVRKRPGMYIGSTGPNGLHHLVYEVVDNSIDEAMAGEATYVEVTLRPDGSCRVVDDGRGIPTDAHPRYPEKSAAEVVLTVLHAGGKFGEGGGYKVSGGLHGVGVSVVNALSAWLELEIDRGGRRYRQRFESGGEPVTPLVEIGQAPPGRRGPTVTFCPDATIFDTTEFTARTLLERFQMMAFLNAGLRISFTDERPGHERTEEYCYDGGVRDFVAHLNQAKDRLFDDVGHFSAVESGDEVEVAFQWNTGYHEGIHSFANGIATIEGGMHEEGFRKALTATVNRYAFAKGLLRDGRDERLQGEDIREGLTAIVSVRLREPQFEGQTWNGPPTTLSRRGSRRTRPRPRRCCRRRSAPRRPGWPPRRPARRPASRRSTVPACPASSPTAPRPIRPSRSCSSSRASRPAERRRRPATRGPWPSCPSGARS